MTAHDRTDEATTDAGGSHELPPEPATRHITPAPEDFENPPGFANYLWPLLWCGLAGLLIATLVAYGWRDVSAH